VALSFDDIAFLFARRGGEQYSGEPVTQLEHALQTATFAEQDGADDGLVTAALLHDLGHLVHDLGETPTLRGIDDGHQYLAVPFLRGLFPEAVLGAISGHVDAKRYLCFVREGYLEDLSEDSKRSLKLQGGVFSADEAAAFIARPGAADAVRLRVWDDRAKIAGIETLPLAHFLDRARRCSLHAT
jgi:phosphonate degradation associated HDIG domain protein